MKTTVETLDMVKTQAHWPKDTPFTPALVRRRHKHDKGRWAVLSEQLMPGEHPSWSYAAHDEYLRIPLFPYMLSSQGDLALAFMLQLGLSCAGHLPGRVTGFYVVTGQPVELLYDDATNENTGLRYWVGFAVIVEET
jgi:hypothetical protein